MQRNEMSIYKFEQYIPNDDGKQLMQIKHRISDKSKIHMHKLNGLQPEKERERMVV